MKKSRKRKMKVQPYIIIEGPSLIDIKNCYVVIADLRYHCNNAREAFDYCFKIYFVANAQYPPQAEHLFQLIQRGIYYIETKLDKIFPNIADLLQLLKS